MTAASASWKDGNTDLSLIWMPKDKKKKYICLSNLDTKKMSCADALYVPFFGGKYICLSNLNLDTKVSIGTQ